MPTYEYRCDNGHVFETIQRMTDDPITKCEVCGAPVQRVFHPVAVHFKGKGFYNTDYGTKKRARELKDAGEGKGKYEKSSDSGSDSGSSKTETKTEKKSGGDSAKKSDSSSSKSSKSD